MSTTNASQDEEEKKNIIEISQLQPRAGLSRLQIEIEACDKKNFFPAGSC